MRTMTTMAILLTALSLGGSSWPSPEEENIATIYMISGHACKVAAGKKKPW